MKRTVLAVIAIVAGFALAWHCGGPAGDDCSPECGPGLVCYHGRCVPDRDAAGEAETGADADAPPDVPAEADVETGADADADVEPETDVDVRPDADVPEDARPETEDARPDTDTVEDVRPDGEIADIADVSTDTVMRCGPASSTLCPSGQVCDLRSCDPTASGICVPRPSACPPFWRPVCGCDGRTYGNDCERLVAGAAFDHEGECDEPPPAAPLCVATPDGGAAWVDGDGTLLCRSNCLTCTAVCLHPGSFSEGWYAACSGSGIDGGCGMVPRLIVWADCSP